MVLERKKIDIFLFVFELVARLMVGEFVRSIGAKSRPLIKKRDHQTKSIQHQSISDLKGHLAKSVDMVCHANPVLAWFWQSSVSFELNFHKSYFSVQTENKCVVVDDSLRRVISIRGL